MTSPVAEFAGVVYRRDGKTYRPPQCSICQDRGFVVITRRWSDKDIERDYLYACTCDRGEKWRKITAAIQTQTGG